MKIFYFFLQLLIFILIVKMSDNIFYKYKNEILEKNINNPNYPEFYFDNEILKLNLPRNNENKNWIEYMRKSSSNRLILEETCEEIIKIISGNTYFSTLLVIDERRSILEFEVTDPIPYCLQFNNGNFFIYDINWK